MMIQSLFIGYKEAKAIKECSWEEYCDIYANPAAKTQDA
jgi:hypothetical protein